MSHPATDRAQLAANLSGDSEWLFFYGHTAPPGELTKACLSQWWDRHPFLAGGVLFYTAEHYMMSYKAKIFDDRAMYERIINAETPREAKALGRKVSNFDEKYWELHRMQAILQANFFKFGEHKELAAFLLETDNRILVEASPTDRIYGIGMNQHHPNAKDPAMWNGLNLLGFALMQVRQMLRSWP